MSGAVCFLDEARHPCETTTDGDGVIERGAAVCFRYGDFATTRLYGNVSATPEALTRT